MKHFSNREGFLIAELVIALALFGVFGSSIFLLQGTIMHRFRKARKEVHNFFLQQKLYVADYMQHGLSKEQGDVYATLFSSDEYTRKEKSVDVKDENEKNAFPHLYIVLLYSKEESDVKKAFAYPLYRFPIKDEKEQGDNNAKT